MLKAFNSAPWEFMFALLVIAFCLFILYALIGILGTITIFIIALFGAIIKHELTK
ncbi:MAG: hypothetical protein WCO84_01645 [bacterium]